jgi:hypothetical protein
MTDINNVPPHQATSDERLVEWSRWVSVHQQGWPTQPMFRFAKSNTRQWEEPKLSLPVDAVAAASVEKLVSALPELHRTVLRWFYVFSRVPMGKVARELGLSHHSLCQVLGEGRDMLKKDLKIN